MIISHKYKFLFIGLPFSASSAITKELNLQYEGKPYLQKHSLYHEFQKKATKEELKYFVFAVLRNPMEIATTIYSKMKSNSKGNFTNPELYKENGGHITKEQRKRFDFIHKNNATFGEYFLNFYTRPYDNLASGTLEKCDFIIRYENISQDYLKALKKTGINNPRPLPVANQTSGKKNSLLSYYNKEIKDRSIYVFGPFMKKYGYDFPKEWGKLNVSFYSQIQFKTLSLLRQINQKFIKNQSKRKSIEGSIYGDIQRKSEGKD